MKIKNIIFLMAMLAVYALYARRVRSLDVKSTEVNTEKGLKTRHFRELGVLFRLSDFFVLGCLQPGRNEG
jgi:hypothetical protein